MTFASFCFLWPPARPPVAFLRLPSREPLVARTALFLVPLLLGVLLGGLFFLLPVICYVLPIVSVGFKFFAVRISHLEIFPG